MDADQLTAILAQIESLDYQPNEARERGVLAGFVFLTHCVKTRAKLVSKPLDKMSRRML